MSRSLPLLALLLALAACAPGVSLVPTEGDVAGVRPAYPDATLAQLEEGHRLYRARCGSCHRPHSPGELAPDAWPDIVADMAERAALSPDQSRAVTRFLVAVSIRAHAPPTPEDPPLGALGPPQLSRTDR
ncbi:MAG: hypothetical protein H6744_08225 [Deltaproteobacteria bacterium]|nr:hypothetical protein [Deltaproteobacteria bacterium]MCB9786664.1 hypothetical protein [Deltaproteobacteria bacterium]